MIINILNKLYKIDNKIYEYMGTEYGNIFWESFHLKSSDKIKNFLIDKVNLDDTLPLEGYNLFRYVYILESQENNNYKFSKIIWKNIKKNKNIYKDINMYADNLGHFIIFQAKYGQGDIKFEKEILSNMENWNNINIDGNTPLHNLVFLNFKKYNSVLKNKKVNLDIKNKNNKTVLDLSTKEWSNYLRKLDTVKNEENKVKLIDSKFSHSNLFSATFIDEAIFMLYFTKKYKNLMRLKYPDYNLNNIDTNFGYFYYDEGEKNFPWIIIYKDKYNYNIHPYLNDIINSNRIEKKYDYCFINLNLILKNESLHANILIYDFNKKTIERFEPYGFSIIDDLDDILEEELTWNTGFTYIKPIDYMNKISFQSISDELNNEKPGDFGGFCLGWCYFYLEHRLLNNNLSQKELVMKLKKKLLKKDLTFSEYIRNYSNNINKGRFKILKKIGIPKNKISDINLYRKYSKTVIDYIKKN